MASAALRGGTLEPRPAFSELRDALGECRRMGLPDRCPLDRFAVQTGCFKLVSSRTPPREALYDLQEDPLETRDVAAERPQELARHRALLERYRQRAEHQPTGTLQLAPDDQIREQLRALGYAP